MGWVDVADDVGNIVKDGASIPGNRIAGEAEYVKARANQIAEPVVQGVNDFVDKGNQEGYAEAIWQDVVQPVAGSSTSRGAIAGGAGALGMDLLDPTPGINPLNIAGGAGVGAVVGTAVPYAVDAVQAMSNPNSMLRGENWPKALEGAGIATGITGEVDQGIQDMIEPGFGEEFTERGLNIAKNVGEGLGNAYQGALAGTNQLGSDVAGFFGFDDIEEMYQVLADDRRKAQTPNSAMGAMAQELSYDAGMGGVLGKATDTLMGAGKGIKAWSNSNVYKRGKEAIETGAEKLLGKAGYPLDKIGGLAGKETRDNALKIAKKEIMDKDTLWAGTRMLADFTGTFSKPTKEFIERNWDMVSANILGGKTASIRKMMSDKNEFGRMLARLKGKVTPEDIAKIRTEMNGFVDKAIKNPDKFKRLMTELGTMPSSASTKLFGTGTAITADVED